MIRIGLKRNPDFEEYSKKPRYFFEVDLEDLMRKTVRSSVPVFWCQNPARHPTLKEIYSTEIAGTQLEKGNLSSLEKMVTEAIMDMVEYGTIPYYYVESPRKFKLPVYHAGGRLQVRLPQGPKFEGKDLGQIRYRIGEYLASVKMIKNMEELEFSILLWKTLKLYPIAFSLINPGRKIWVPIFWFDNGQLNYDVIDTPSRIVPVSDMFDLCKQVSTDLIADRRISSPSEVKVSNVSSDFRAAFEGEAKKTDGFLTYYEMGNRVEIPILEVGENLFALHSGITFAKDYGDLQRKFSDDLRISVSIEMKRR